MASLPAEHISVSLDSMNLIAKNLAESQPGAREQLLSRTYELISKLETPSEFVQRMGWAEVRIQ